MTLAHKEWKVMWHIPVLVPEVHSLKLDLSLANTIAERNDQLVCFEAQHTTDTD